jgi:two-component system, sensor histidine kinase LadS
MTLFLNALARAGIGLLLLLCCSLQAVADLELDNFAGGPVPGQQMIFFEDVSANLDFEEARQRLAQDGQRWIAPGQPNFGFRRSALWVRVDLTNRFAEPDEWVASVGFPNLDRVDFYHQDAGGHWQQDAAGNALPFRARQIMPRSINFEFTVLPSQSMSLYFRVETPGSLQFPLSLGSSEFFADQVQPSLFILGVFYGLMLMIAIYSFTVWISSRESGFLYFTLFLIFGILYSLSAQGLAYQYLWSGSHSWTSRAASVFSMIASIAGLQFVRAFLKLKQVNVWLDKVAHIFAILLMVGAFTSLFIDPALVNRLALINIFILALLITAAGFVARHKQVREANFFMFAWAILLLGIFIELIQRIGVLIPPVLAYHGIQMATVSAITVLALGLNDRLQGMMEGYKGAQQDLLKANQLKIDALQQADSVKEEFIANVSHELRTPLTGIIGLAEIMLADQPDNLDETQRETLTLMKVSAQRLSSLVNDVIDYSAMKNGQLALDKTDVDIKQVCAVVVKITKPLIGAKPIKIVENYMPGEILVEGDQDRLQQVLFNLVANAVKFTPHGIITIAVEVIDRQVRVSVSDTGIGISASEQENIFKRFYQVDANESRQVGGTGLGLSISQRLLELHNSEIVLRSKLGEGSLFYFDLPLKSLLPAAKKTAKWTNGNGNGNRNIIEDDTLIKGSGTPPLAAALQATGLTMRSRRTERVDDAVPGSLADSVPVKNRGGPRGKILVVDDEYLNLRIVESHLSATYELTTALSGAEALEKLAISKPDLIILDLMMPVMSGYQFCRIVRKQYDSDELPIVMLTARNRVDDMVRGLSLGANDYITKPFSKEELCVRVDKQFELQNLQHLKRDYQRLNWQLQRYEENESRLREREKRLAVLLDVTGDPLLAIDETGLVIYINTPAEALLQLSSAACLQQSVNVISSRLMSRSPALADAVHFPFNEAMISQPGNTDYFDYELDGRQGRFCLLTMNQLDQEFYLVVFEQDKMPVYGESAANQREPDTLSLPQIVSEINRNVERTQLLGEYLTHIKPDDLNKHKELVGELGSIDKLINILSGTLVISDDDNSEIAYREALVKVMQDCHYYWQKVTGESIIDLAEKSRIWSVSIDNGRLRTRSMNRYLSLDKLPSNPRWRQVARTAYFVLSRVSSDQEARHALESSLERLQEIVERKAFN